MQSRQTKPTQMELLRAEFFNDLAAVAAHRCRDFGLDEKISEQIGAGIADAVCEAWGGQVISVPKDHAYRLAMRDVEVLRRHRAGESLASLALGYRMTIRGLRKLLHRAALRAPDEFDDGSR